jgi:hypothetical protein
VKQTVSGKIKLKQDTNSISYYNTKKNYLREFGINYYNTSIVKNSFFFYYPQVTKAHLPFIGTQHQRCLLSTQVETSEIIRLLSIKNSNIWNEWLAGLIDGDGSFLLSKAGYASLEITMDLRDSHCLYQIKNKFGGSIKLRSGYKAIRYRLHHKIGLLSLIKAVNGHIRNPNRMVQLEKICKAYNLTFIYPLPLTFSNGWLAGFFDADGTITINKSNTQLSISVSQKTPYLLNPLINLYGGNVYIDNSTHKSFKWYISSQTDILKLIEYFKIFCSRSAKNHRFLLIPRYYELKILRAHKASENTILNKS